MKWFIFCYKVNHYFCTNNSSYTGEGKVAEITTIFA